jgi:hypothetical protein
MKLRRFVIARVAACGLCGALAASGAAGFARAAQDKQDKPKDQKEQAPQVPEGELKAARAVESAADAGAALTAAGAFVKKYPKSKIRSQVAQIAASKVAATTDAAQRATLVDAYLKAFASPEEADLIAPLRLDAYLAANRLDDAFALSSPWLAKRPEDVASRTRLALIGIEQASRGNAKFAQQSQQYGAAAVAIIEAGKKPADMDDATWAQYRTTWLPHLYQSLGFLANKTGDKADARAKLEKAAALGITDPTTYALLGQMLDDEYQEAGKRVNAMPGGAARDAAFKEAQAQMDKVIEYFAQAVALTEGKPQYEPVRAQVMPPLTSYYKYRRGSTDGLQEMIDKYKKPAAGTTPK